MKKSLLTILSLMLILITGTYSWMLSDNITSIFTDVGYDYNNDSNDLIIASNDIDLKIFFYDEESEDYVISSDSSLNIKNLVPNTIVNLKVRLSNVSGYTQVCKLTLNDIVATESVILDYMYILLAPSDGYNQTDSSIVMPETILIKLSENNSGSLVLYDSLYVPSVSNSNNYVELRGYILFDRNAGWESMNKEFSLGKFTLVI